MGQGFSGESLYLPPSPEGSLPSIETGPLVGLTLPAERIDHLQRIAQPDLYTTRMANVGYEIGPLLEHVSGNRLTLRKTFTTPFTIHVGDGSYNVLGVLGVGGSAVVWEVQSLTSSRNFALRAELVVPEDALNLIEHSVDLTARLGMKKVGPKLFFAVVAIADTGPHLLLTLLEHGRPVPRNLTISQGLDLVARVQSLLRKMFALHIYCFDIKPANTIILDDGEVRLIDFDYKYCVEALRSKGFRRLVPDEIHDLERVLLLQYALMLANDRTSLLRNTPFMRKFITNFGFPVQPQELSELYQRAISLSPQLAHILAYYNRNVFGGGPQLFSQFIARV